ncbi:bifunctional phosphopantothenoylcysteine decarboxylase/phosphopantothenate--cysteine ligase CoaBC [Aquidulcibacter sp.]|uniref:bifunctional phosphopantothenoylcysteine decarboxylase/phosphopantothenate--cysteine ligase CoaBC n=1 Tax=Aquidulcibacter sp. TaxID=2052990 RepID=UPI0025BA962E|nr:bifunctional phosphopantothenoylcysteine decarboxylase/phosphopantothenate--cysteine ligase CoaBC [Aquidulcibacter sp.]MCA3691938.1 bifunctional phosphopantothenoylcysteine decarboxylase/phosphopantothenate--cysteine ligase CoaBC [Aquidulcibacter sp.]
MSLKRVLLIVGGGISAYKAPELVRALDKHGIGCRVILTQAGSQFVTPLTLASLTKDDVHQELFNLTHEAKMGHIELSRSADLVLVAPATADLIGKVANGLANDLASTALLATDKPVLMAPAMNVRMWEHPAVQRNLATLRADGVHFIGPDEGAMACGEYGLGRMAEPEAIATALEAFWYKASADKPLRGKRAVVTAGPTLEAFDPIRFLSNRSSGKQGYAIAHALAEAGAVVTLVSGPTALNDVPGVSMVRVESAREMLAACQSALPADIFVAVAAVADWRPETRADVKLKLKGDVKAPAMTLVENPDILATIAQPGPKRPKLVIGFAAETHEVLAYATAKRTKKGCDWVVANDVSGDVMGGESNRILLVTAEGHQSWPEAPKTQIAVRLAEAISAHFKTSPA